MSRIPTPHIEAKLGEIEKTVVMPGDPLRAKFIAENFLQDVVCFNTIRNVLGFSGTYKDKRISVMGSGMGNPSMGIYSFELYNFYDVENIIRIGTAGALNGKVNLMDVVLALGVCTDSNYASQFNLPGSFAPTASFTLLEKAVAVAKNKGLPIKVGNVLSTDVFYTGDQDGMKSWRDMGVLAVEMESLALYVNAAKANKNALCMLSISDYIFKGEALSSKQRQESLTDMIELALDTALLC